MIHFLKTKIKLIAFITIFLLLTLGIISRYEKIFPFRKEVSFKPLKKESSVKKEAFSKEKYLLVNLELSPFSQPKGTLKVFWGKELFKKYLNSPSYYQPVGPLSAEAQPLDLVEKVKIFNPNDEKVYLTQINNETLKGIKIHTALGSPIFLLPEKFILNGTSEVKCQNRKLTPLTKSDLEKGKIFNNICIFNPPIEIPPHKEITLEPQIYFLIGKCDEPRYCAEILSWRFEYLDKLSPPKREANYLWVSVPNLRKKYLLLGNLSTSSFIGESGEIGGYIFLNSKDEKLLNQIFHFELQNGKKVLAKIFDVSKSSLKIKHIRDLLFSNLLFKEEDNFRKGEFYEQVLDLELFLYKAGDLEFEKINGIWDEENIKTLKKIQKEYHLAETGKLDEATLLVLRNKLPSNAVSCYGFDYGGRVFINFKEKEQNLFRFFGIQHDRRCSDYVKINKNFSTSSLIQKVVYESPSNSNIWEVTLIDSRKNKMKIKYTWIAEVFLVNDLNFEVTCSIKKENGELINKFSLAPNQTKGILGAPESYNEFFNTYLKIFPTKLTLSCIQTYLECTDKPAFLSLNESTCKEWETKTLNKKLEIIIKK